MKILTLILSLIYTSIVFSQIDTATIYSEIRSLKSDDEIDRFWFELRKSDQTLHTFNNPILQTENLLKVVYFFKYFGVSEYCYFDKTKMINSDIFEFAQIIWIHQQYADMNAYTYPLIEECNKLNVVKHIGYDGYFIQGVVFSRDKERGVKVYEKIKNNKFEDIDVDSLSNLALTFRKLYREIDSNPIEQGIWRYYKNYKMILYRSNDGNYYLDAGNSYKLKKVNDKTFKFFNGLDESYFEIQENGDLVFKTSEGNVLDTYKKYELNY